MEQLVLATPALRAALSDTAVTGPARRAVLRDLLEGKVTEPARRLDAFAAGAVAAPDVLGGSGLGRPPHPAGGRRCPRAGAAPQPEPGAGAGGWLRPGALRDDADRGHGGDGGQPLPLRPHRRVRSGAAHRADRSRPAGGVPPGPGAPVTGGKGHGGHSRPGRLRGGRRTGPRLRGHAGLAGRADRPRPGVAHRPGEVGGRHRGGAEVGVVRHPGESGGVAGRAPGRPGPDVAEWRRHPDRRPAGGRQCPRPHRCAAGASRARRVGRRPRRVRGPTEVDQPQREQTDGRADDRRQRNHGGAGAQRRGLHAGGRHRADRAHRRGR